MGQLGAHYTNRVYQTFTVNVKDPCWASRIREEDAENMPAAEDEEDDAEDEEVEDANRAVLEVTSHELMNFDIVLMQLLVFTYLPFYDTETRYAETGAHSGYPEDFNCGTYSYQATPYIE